LKSTSTALTERSKRHIKLVVGARSLLESLSAVVADEPAGSPTEPVDRYDSWFGFGRGTEKVFLCEGIKAFQIELRGPGTLSVPGAPNRSALAAMTVWPEPDTASGQPVEREST
jgi:hypothetical protein